MQQLRIYEEQFGVVIRSGWIANDLSLTINPKRTIITYSSALPPTLALLGVATMIEVLEMNRAGKAGWEGRQFRFRYPLADDNYQTKNATARARRDYRIPERRAIRRLIPDDMLEQAAREEWESWRLLEVCGLDQDTCQRRVREWRDGRSKVVSMVAFAWDGPIPF